MPQRLKIEFDCRSSDSLRSALIESIRATLDASYPGLATNLPKPSPANLLLMQPLEDLIADLAVSFMRHLDAEIISAVCDEARRWRLEHKMKGETVTS